MTGAMVRRKHELPGKYLFYPAYFSYHKNHLYILDALIELERRHGIVLHAVFCGGGDPGDQTIVELQTQALGLTERVHFLGLVDDDVRRDQRRPGAGLGRLRRPDRARAPPA